MGKTRYLFKKMEDTKGTFHAKMGTIKNRNSKHLTEAEEIKKQYQEQREEIYKKDFHDPENNNDVATPLKPDFEDCEVKQALGSITVDKTSGDNGIPAELLYYKS